MSQQEMIVKVSGKTKFTITLDPGSFIFDSRRINLDLDEQEPAVSRKNSSAEAWDRHRSGGMKVRNENEVRVNREELKTNSFGIPLLPFLENASPNEDARSVVFKGANGTSAEFPLGEVKEAILKFSDKGQPLKETGPVHVIMPGSESPITHVEQIQVT
ncbi:hypothetical protein [Alteribacter natronophilus]|uniref:hypothetical protein n=1 Tax=Alteribacter natronophilus TaxID=2583810 RepID=UPI00110F0AD2|nr:hypothetical protein [Alteribacter natronophilus]TMW73080.1 hypothetical protein FGB90_01865 [Alteribacter natronophilus]